VEEVIAKVLVRIKRNVLYEMIDHIGIIIVR